MVQNWSLGFFLIFFFSLYFCILWYLNNTLSHTNGYVTSRNRLKIMIFYGQDKLPQDKQLRQDQFWPRSRLTAPSLPNPKQQCKLYTSLDSAIIHLYADMDVLTKVSWFHPISNENTQMQAIYRLPHHSATCFPAYFTNRRETWETILLFPRVHSVL